MNLLLKILILVSSSAAIEGWAFPRARNLKSVFEKSLIVGAAGGFVLGTVTAAGTAIALNEQIQSRPTPYVPPCNSMANKVVLITGGTSGLGLESAKRLGAAGATIVLASRTSEKGIEAVESVLEYVASRGVMDSKIYNLQLDLDDLSTVKAFPDSFGLLCNSTGLRSIDVLLNNAGVMAIPRKELTVDGFERTFQSNHLGHFVLTAGLFPYLNRDNAIVVNVSSEAYQIARRGLEIDNLNGEKNYGAWTSYGQSKLANILFTRELQRRANKSGDSSWLTAVTLHPGAVSTDLGRYVIGADRWSQFKENAPAPLEKLVRNTLSLVTKTVEHGASTQVFLATGADGNLQPGGFYDECKVKPVESFAASTSDAKKLWEKSEELGGIVFSLDSAMHSGVDAESTSQGKASSGNEDDMRTQATVE